MGVLLHTSLRRAHKQALVAAAVRSELGGAASRDRSVACRIATKPVMSFAKASAKVGRSPTAAAGKVARLLRQSFES